MIYLLLWFIVICQRTVELVIAKSNENWMRNKGAKIVEEGHYKWIVSTHATFILLIFVESYSRHQFQNDINNGLFLVFISLQLFRVWCLYSLGRFWNTKIIVLPKVALIKKGPYKYIRHPNYLVVGLEFIIIPLLFQAYYTAIVFPVLHIVLMYYRIPTEEKALQELKE